MWPLAGNESGPRAINTKPRLSRGLAFNVIVAVLIGVGFGAQAVAQESVVGAWSTANPNPFPFFPVHTNMLPSGKVMIWPGDEGISGNDPRSWDPANESVSPLAPPGFDVFCTGHSFLADGRLFVAGGHIQNGVGLANASIYDPSANTWTTLPAMNAGRWYPTATVLANGDVLVVSGSIDNVVGANPVPQVFQVASGTWRNLAQLGMDLYPAMLLAPNGKVFNPGPTQDTRYLDTAGSGTWSFVARRVGPYRDYGSAVMYAPGKVLVMGGGDPPTNTAEVIDLNQPSPTWRAVGSMAFARRQLNATLLPNGNVLVTGGTSAPGGNNPAGAVHAAELWNPTTEQWTTLASTTSGIPRIYHSTAVLLPDGRILSMGGNVLSDYPNTRTSEIYSPPYLFKGARPTITSAPTSVTYGQSFFVGTPDAAAISKVTMLRLTSVTHAFNMSQHISTPNFSQAAGGLNVVAPAGGTAAPPGPYLLFILNGSGVPSVARIVQIGSDPAALTLTSLSPDSAAAGGPAFTLTVNGSNFVSGSVVRWNGANRTTTFVNAARLTAAIPASDIAAAGSASVTVRNPSGAVSNALTCTITAITREVWTGISGTNVANIPVGSAPNFTDTLPSFEAPTNWADNYATRMRAYIRAPVTGNYTFWIASDDNSELWLSTNDNPAAKVRIALVPEWTDSREWNKFPSQKSAPITLTAGQRYYVEALQKEGGGGDNLAVGWAKPGESTSTPSEVISGSVLSPFTGGDQPAAPEINVLGNGTTILDGDTSPSGSDHTDFGSTDVTNGTVTRTFSIQNLGTASLTVNTVTLSGANAADFSVVVQPASTVAAGGNTSFQVQFNPSAVGTRSATVSVGNNDADENAYDFAVQGTGVTAGSGSISREVWTGINGTSVASIPVGTPPSFTDTLPTFEAPTNWADDYGTRLRGYITAPVSGSYTFWIASDDNSELWLSTNDNPANKVSIASVPEWTDSREWNRFPSQKSAPINLTAGRRYYVEALQKEGGGGDNLAVGWGKPGESTSAPSEVIPGSVLSPFSGTAAPMLSSIAVTPPSPSILTGATQQFTATGTYSNGSTQNITSQVTWASSSTTTATINANGLATGVSAGTTTISATLSGVIGSTALTVQAAPATLSSIAVTPPSPSILTGATQQFTATGTYSNGSTQNITSQVTWASSSTTVATINGSGLATGVSAGSTTISATLSGVTGSTTLTVQASPAPAPLAITTISLPDATINVAYNAANGDPIRLTATGGTPPYTWSISSGSLPPGLSLNPSTGVISGTPTSAASTTAPYRFTAQVKDAASPQRTATQPLSIKVRKR